ncbi:MAG: tyrosine-type recombinase/integrase [bacterium]|jgi:integrase|nr:tyrosine-type recombinase/integrase [bacterium]
MRTGLQDAADAVVAAAEAVGLSQRRLLDYRNATAAVLAHCQERGFLVMTMAACRDVVAAQRVLEHQGVIRTQVRRDRVRSARMMEEFGRTGQIVWRVFARDVVLCEAFAGALALFSAEVEPVLAPATVGWMVGDARRFLGFVEGLGRTSLDTITVEDIRAHLAQMGQRRPGGVRNIVKMLKRLFALLNRDGLSDVQLDGLLARTAPERARALPCFTREEIHRLTASIQTDTACGKRDYAMVMLALSTGLRSCDIVALRLDEIDWRGHEIRVVQSKTGQPLVVPLSARVGNAIADWILAGRPVTSAPQVFVRLLPPLTKLTSNAGAAVMSRRLAGARIAHEPGDGKTFHALRRTAGTRLVEGGVPLPLVAQILGHAQVDSSRRYIALAGEQMRQCALPLSAFACMKAGLS